MPTSAQLATLPQGSQVGPYRLQRVLGSGGTGAVYEALREHAGRVALKVMHESDAAALYRLKREFRAVSGIVHPNLVTLYDLAVDGDRAYFTMELVEGVSLLRYVSATGLESSQHLARLCATMVQLAEAVVALHGAGTLHRDLKPSNILVTETGRVVVLDFGLATPLQLSAAGSRASEYALAGTLGYLAPELFASARRLTPASDWYSVGIILFEALTGLPPPVGHPPELPVDPPPWARESPGDESRVEELVALCARLIAMSPRDRPSGDEVLRCLRAIGSPSPRAPDTFVQRSAVPTLTGSPFVGRERELALLADAYTQVIDHGRPTSIYVRGPSGSGKSALLHHFLAHLPGAGRTPVILSSRCYERETLPYQGCDGLFDALSSYLRSLPESECLRLLPQRPRDLTRTFPVLDRVDAIRKVTLSDQADNAPEREQRRRSVRALRDLLGRIADRQPLVVWLDDLQWGDADSAHLIGELLSPPDSPALLFVGCYRSEDSARSPMLQALDDADAAMAGRDRAAVRRVDLPPLPPADVRTLASGILDARVDEQQLERIVAESQGHAYFVVALARHVKEHAGPMGEPPPASLAAAVRSHLASLAVCSRVIVDLVAMAGRPVAPQILVAAAQDLAGFSNEEVRAGERQALGGGLLRTVRIRERGAIDTYHDRVREIATADLGPERRHQLHHALARAFASAEEVDAERVARHLHAAGRSDEAMSYALVAADRASAEMAFEHAADLYELARSCGGGLESGLVRRHADVLFNAGRCAEAAPLYVLSADHAAPGDVFELRRLGVEMYLMSGLPDDGIAILRPMVAAAGLAFPESQTAALAALLFGRARVALRGLAFRERDRAPDDLLQKIEVCISVVKSAAIFEPLVAAAFLMKGLLLALDCGEPRHAAYALGFFLAIEASFGTPHHEQEPHWQTARNLARRSSDETLVAVTAFLEGVALLNCGLWREAFESMARADRTLRFSRRGLPWEIGGRSTFLRLALYFQGLLPEFLSLVAQHRLETKQTGDVLEYASCVLHGAFVALRDDTSDRAREAVADSMSRYPTPRLHDSLVWPGVCLLVHCDLYEGRPAQATTRLREAWPSLKRSGVLRASVWGTLFSVLRAYAALSEGAAGAQARGRKLAEKLGRSPHRWVRPFGYVLDACSASHGTGQDHVLQMLSQAADGFERADMALYAACARRRHAEVLGGEVGATRVAAADASLRSQGIMNPERWAAMYVPLPIFRRDP